MKNYILLILFLCSRFVSAEIIEIRKPVYFDRPIRDGFPLFPDSLCFDSEAEELTFPDMGMFVRLGEYHFPNLRKITLGNTDYIPNEALRNMPQLEEIVINGLVGYFDGALAVNCPNLQKIVINGPVAGLGGSCRFAYDCPKLDSIIFNSVVCDFQLVTSRKEDVPLKSYIYREGFFNMSNNALQEKTITEQMSGHTLLKNELKRLARWQMGVLNSPQSGLKHTLCKGALLLMPYLKNSGNNAEAESLLAAAMALGDCGYFEDETKTKLEILKEYYLETYMAKNLYIISANMLNQASPEGPSNRRKGTYVALVPQHCRYSGTHIVTTDDEWFWQSPE